MKAKPSSRLEVKENQRKKLDLLIKRFSSSAMNNAKWVKLLDALTIEDTAVKMCQTKLVWDSEPRKFFLDDTCYYGYDYYHNAVEGLISGIPRGFYEYREIEWILFPHDSQDVKRIESQISTAGEFDYVITSTGLKLFGYRNGSDA